MSRLCNKCRKPSETKIFNTFEYEYCPDCKIEVTEEIESFYFDFDRNLLDYAVKLMGQNERANYVYVSYDPRNLEKLRTHLHCSVDVFLHPTSFYFCTPGNVSSMPVTFNGAFVDEGSMSQTDINYELTPKIALGGFIRKINPATLEFL